MLIEAIKKQSWLYPDYKYRERIKNNTGLYYRMNELNLVACDNGFLEIKSPKELYEKYADDIKTVYDVILITRKHKTIAKYWILMQALEYHFNISELNGNEYPMTAKLYDIYFKRKYLGFDNIYNPLSKRHDYYDKHINYNDMPDESNFMDYFSKVTTDINQMGYDVDELINSMDIDEKKICSQITNGLD